MASAKGARTAAMWGTGLLQENQGKVLGELGQGYDAAQGFLGQTGNLYVTRITCPAVTPTTAPVVGCSPTGTAPGGYDRDGKIVECTTADTTTYNTDYPSPGPVPVASCTPGTQIDPTTKEQTTCTTMLSSGPTAVQSCTELVPTAPHYLKITCTSHS